MRRNVEKSDQRILGSGNFVSMTLEQSDKVLEKKYLPKRPIEELIEMVSEKMGVKPELICSRSRKKLVSDIRSLVAWYVVEEAGHSAADVARYLGISRVGVLLAVKNGKGLANKYNF